MASIPKEVSRYRPGPCTEVKYIKGKYYVYMYKSKKLDSGSWGKESGPCIGRIIPGVGFQPNDNYHLYDKNSPINSIHTLEYGQYELVAVLGAQICGMLSEHFGVNIGTQIFTWAVILCVNGMIHRDQIYMYYIQSWLSEKYKMFTFSMKKDALSSLLNFLGRRAAGVISYERAMLEAASAVAIDGHVIRSCSEKNDLAEAGYKAGLLKSDQINMLMGYEVNSRTPLFARIFRGSTSDKSTIKELDMMLKFHNILFVIDRGFYSETNARIFTENNNSYIVPIPSNTKIFKNAMEDIKYTHSFYYRSGKKVSRIQYKTVEYTDFTVYVFRDIDENEKCRFNYQRNIDLGKGAYTEDGLKKVEEFFGVYVLQSNANLSPEEVYGMYKKRWGIETFYQYVKNDGNFNNLTIQDYYEEQGLSFILLIAGQLHQKLIEAVALLHDSTTSVHDLLSEARFFKLYKKREEWELTNYNAKFYSRLEKVGCALQQLIPLIP